MLEKMGYWQKESEVGKKGTLLKSTTRLIRVNSGDEKQGAR